MEGYAEFYISCNPPLLPNGVSLIITDLTKELESVSVTKILSNNGVIYVFTPITDGY
jgi:hypothetical protein